MGHAGDDALTLVRAAGWSSITTRFTRRNKKPGRSALPLLIAPQYEPDHLSPHILVCVRAVLPQAFYPSFFSLIPT